MAPSRSVVGRLSVDLIRNNQVISWVNKKRFATKLIFYTIRNMLCRRAWHDLKQSNINGQAKKPRSQSRQHLYKGPPKYHKGSNEPIAYNYVSTQGTNQRFNSLFEFEQR